MMSDTEAEVKMVQILDPNRKFYWHICYHATGSDSHDGFNHTAFKTTRDVMSLTDAVEFIKTFTGASKIVIVSWKEIRRDIYEQFCEEGGLGLGMDCGS